MPPPAHRGDASTLGDNAPGNAVRLRLGSSDRPTHDSRVPPAAAPSVKGDVLRTGFELTHEPRP
jgi:hypothetical protein